MAGQDYNPLTQEHLQRIDTELRRLTQWGPLYDKMERCGIDCSEYRQQNDLITEWLNTVKREFFPGSVPGGAVPTPTPKKGRR